MVSLVIFLSIVSWRLTHVPSTVVLVKVLIVQAPSFKSWKLKLKPEHIWNHRTPRVDWILPTKAQTDNQLQSIIVKLESGKLSLDIILVAWFKLIVINLKVFWTFIASSQSPGPFDRVMRIYHNPSHHHDNSSRHWTWTCKCENFLVLL